MMLDYKSMTKERLIGEIDLLRKRITELEANSMLIKGIGNAFPDVILLLNEDGILLEFITGEDDLRLMNTPATLSSHIDELLPPDTSGIIREAVNKAIKTGETQIIEYSLDVHGGRKCFEGRIAPLPALNKSKKTVIMIARDITERNRMQETLRISDAALKSIRECMFVVDNNYMITYWNDMCEKIFGINASEALGTSIFDQYELIEEYPGQNEERKRMLDEQRYNHAEERFRTSKGIIWVDVQTQEIIQDGEWAGWITLAHDITERKQLEESLRLSDAALRSIHEGVFAYDIDFNVTSWNNICEEIFGIDASDAIGKYIGDVIKLLENYPGQNQERLELLINRGYNWEEQVYITPKGNVWVDVRVQAIEQNGKRYGWITLVNDITERKRVEEELKQSEERFSKAFRSVPDSIIISRKKDGLFMEVNDSFINLIGYSREELIGHTSKELGIWVDINVRKKVIDLLEKESRVERYEHEFRKKSGETGIALISVEPIMINGEECIISVSTDITESKKAEEQIRYQASLAENVTDAIISHDENLKIISWNKAAERIFKAKKEDALEKDIRELCRIEPVNTDVKQIRTSLSETGAWKGEAIHRLKDGNEIYMRVSTIVIKENINSKPTYVMIMSDITEEKKAQEELKQHYENEKTLRLEIENEMNKRIELAAGIVHELKTPLTAIISSSELMKQYSGEGALKRLAQNINQSAYDLDKRTGELLDMASGDAGILEIDKKPLDFHELMDSLAFDFNAFLSSKNISFILDIPPDLPKIMADETRLRQVLHNLVNNAYKYTDEGGDVIIRIKKTRKGMTVEVKDTGRGLTGEEQQYIFEPYNRLTGGNRPVGGLGLGLSISSNLVKAHGGEMWVKSRKGAGSSFFFSIPSGNSMSD